MLNALEKLFKKDHYLPPAVVLAEGSKRFAINTKTHLFNALLDAVIEFLFIPHVWNLGLVNKDLNQRIHQILPSNGKSVQQASRFIALYLRRQLNQGFVTAEVHRELLEIRQQSSVICPIEYFACSAGILKLFQPGQIDVYPSHLKGLKVDLLNDSTMHLLAKYTKLTVLDLESSEHVTDKGLTQLSVLTRLQKLNLKGCREISDKGLKSLRNLPLRTLILSNCTVTGESLTALKGLKELDLSGCSEITNAALQGLSRLSLRILKFKDSRNTFRHLTHAGLHYLSECTTLQQVDIRNFTDAAMHCLPYHLKKITVSEISDGDLQGIIQCTQLEELYFLNTMNRNGISSITDKGLSSLLACGKLRILALEWCDEITADGVQALAALSMLKKIRIMNCRKITQLGMLQGLNMFNSLEELTFFEIQGPKVRKSISSLTKLRKLECRSTEISSLRLLTNLHTLMMDSSGYATLTKKDVKKNLAHLPLLRTLALCCDDLRKTLKHVRELSHIHTLNLELMGPFRIAESIDALRSLTFVHTLILCSNIDLQTKKKLRQCFEIVHV